MKILITGATGFIGSKLTEALFTAGHQIVVVSRSREKAQRQLPWPIDIVEGDLGKGPLDSPLLKGVEGVINLAGENIGEGSWSEEEKKKIRNSRVALSENLSQSLDHNALKAWLQTSAIGYYRDSQGDEWLDENSPTGDTFLAEVTRAWERPARNLENKIRVAIARIGVVLGSDGALIEKLLPLFRSGIAGPLGDGQQWMSWVHVRDVVRFFTQAIEDESFKGIYNLTAPEPVRNEDFTKVFGELAHRPAFFRAPAFAIKGLMGEKSYLALSSQRIASRLESSPFSFKFPGIKDALVEVCGHRAIAPHSDARFHYTLRKAMFVARDAASVFEFFRDPSNLSKSLSSDEEFELVDAPEDGLTKGSRFSFKVKKLGLSTTLESEVFEYSPPKGFMDCQIRGPFKCWHHEHEVIEVPGGCKILDHVWYNLPGGVFGDLAASIKGRKEIENMFSDRAKGIKSALESSL